MNEDIKILREALAELEAAGPIGISGFWRACDPDRIRRLLNDAERWQAFTEAVGMYKSSFTIRWHGERMTMEKLKNYCDGWREE